MVVWTIVILNPSNDIYIIIWPGILFINMTAGLLFFFFPRLSFSIVGLSLILATLFYGSFGWGQIVTTIGSIMISLKLRTFLLNRVADERAVLVMSY